MPTLPDSDNRNKSSVLLHDRSLCSRDSFGESYITVIEREAFREPGTKQADYRPTAEDAAEGKALINFLMQDKFFLVLLRSNDPTVRAAAMEKLNKAHYQAYGD